MISVQRKTEPTQLVDNSFKNYFMKLIGSDLMPRRARSDHLFLSLCPMQIKTQKTKRLRDYLPTFLFIRTLDSTTVN